MSFSVQSVGELFAVTSLWLFTASCAERVINHVRWVLLFCFALLFHSMTG